MIWTIALAAAIVVLACLKWHALALAVAAVLAAAGFARGTLFSRLPVRRTRWRIRFRLRPGPGFASFPELAVRWSRLAAVRHGRRVRPDLSLWRGWCCRRPATPGGWAGPSTASGSSPRKSTRP